jgi:hypothetical protein
MLASEKVIDGASQIDPGGITPNHRHAALWADRRLQVFDCVFERFDHTALLSSGATDHKLLQMLLPITAVPKDK